MPDKNGIESYEAAVAAFDDIREAVAQGDPKPGDVIRDAVGELWAWTSGQGGESPDRERDRALAALDELEAERDVLKHAAAMVENPEYVAALQQAGVEYVEQLVARIERLEAALREIAADKNKPWFNARPAGGQAARDIARQALEHQGGE